MKHLFPIFILTLLCYNSLYGQDRTYGNGSVYSPYGIGSVHDFRDAYAGGMGLQGVNIVTYRTANMSNPALIGYYSNTTASGGILYQQITSASNSEKSEHGLLSFEPMSIIFPVDKSKWGFNVSLIKKTSINYAAAINGIIPGDTTVYQNSVQNQGGISAFEIGFGYRINNNWAIGYAPSLLFGNVQTRNSLSVNDINYQRNRLEQIDGHSGFAHKFGLHFQKSGLFVSKDAMSAGLVFTLPTHLTINRYLDNYVITGGFERFVSDKSASGTGSYPMEIIFGSSYYLENNISLNSEVLFQNWSSYKNIHGESEAFYRNRSKFSLGAALDPDLRKADTFLKGISYKLGFSYDTGYLTIDGNKINAIGVYGGVSVPSFYTSSSIDINVSYQIMGTKNNNFLQENMFSVNILLNLSEFMFFRRQIQ